MYSIKEAKMLKRRLTNLSLMVLMLAALLSVVFMVPVPVLAQGATQIGGTVQFDEAVNYH